MTIVIIQARMGSTRLPGKVLKVIEGKTLLEHLILRLKRSKTLDKIILATTDRAEDHAIEKLAESLGIEVFRGSENDVLDRYYQCARINNYPRESDIPNPRKSDVKNPRESEENPQKSDIVIVRITGDCPLMDPAVVDDVVNFYRENKEKFDYASNIRPPTYPDGMDVEVFSFSTLEKAWKEAKLTSEREHVTAYIGNHPEIFNIGNLEYSNVIRENSKINPRKSLENIRLTVDNQEDLLLIQKIFSELYPKDINFGLNDILDYIEKNPELLKINRRVERNEGYKKSLKEDEAANN